MKRYPIAIEIAGPTAMWTRVDSGDAPTSYEAPTFQAAKQIFESILWLRSAEVIPTRVEICRPIVRHRYYTNYGGPLREGGGEGFDSHQLIATVLINVHYRIFARVESYKPRAETLSARAIAWRAIKGMNGAHAYQEMFTARMRRGQYHHVPFLGWKEFTPTLLKLVENPEAKPGELEPKPDKTVEGIEIPSMVFRTFERGQWTARNVDAVKTDAVIRKGVLWYAE